MMPKDKDKEGTNHPCHLLSLPQARRFWCRHCMTVFEDAITRWRHSRSCRYGSHGNFMKRRELEAKALQNTVALSPLEATLGQSIQMSDLNDARNSLSYMATQEPDSQPDLQSTNADNFTCFICHKRFESMEAMRNHVKYPCSNTKIIETRVPHPKNSMPVLFDTLPAQHQVWKSDQVSVSQSSSVQPHIEPMEVTVSENTPQTIEDQPIVTAEEAPSGGEVKSDSITPTSIYVNDQGETVIEVENLDLNTEGGELSLAHLLTQLSQQGIVFDKAQQALQTQEESSVSESEHVYTNTDNTYQVIASSESIKEEEEQPTAEEAANTLAQLAGFRGFHNNGGASTSYYTETTSVNVNQQDQAEGVKIEYHEQTQPHNENEVHYEYEQSSDHHYQVIEASDDGDKQVGTIQMKVNESVGSCSGGMYMTYVPSSDLREENSQANDTDDHQLGHTVEVKKEVVPQFEISHHQHEHLVALTPNDIAKNDAVSVDSQTIIINTSSEAVPVVNTFSVSAPEIEGVVSSVTTREPHDIIPTQDVPVADSGDGESSNQAVDEAEKEEDFEIETVTLQEIVESETSGLAFNHHRTSAVTEVEPTICFSDPAAEEVSHLPESGHVILSQSEVKTVEGDELGQTLTVERGHLTQTLNEMTGTLQYTVADDQDRACASTMYVVTSTGIQQLISNPGTGTLV